MLDHYIIFVQWDHWDDILKQRLVAFSSNVEFCYSNPIIVLKNYTLHGQKIKIGVMGGRWFAISYSLMYQC